MEYPNKHGRGREYHNPTGLIAVGVIDLLDNGCKKYLARCNLRVLLLELVPFGHVFLVADETKIVSREGQRNACWVTKLFPSENLKKTRYIALIRVSMLVSNLTSDELFSHGCLLESVICISVQHAAVVVEEVLQVLIDHCKTGRRLFRPG